MTRTHYIFVDFENIHQVDLDLVAGKSVVVILVLGERHKNLPVDLVEKFLKYPAQVRLIRTGRSGRNALDFVLAYRIGVESVANPKGFFHVVSHDTGFDALILHLKNNHILAARHESFAKALGLSSGDVPPLTERLEIARKRLAKSVKSRPKRKKTLKAQINAYFGKHLSDGELDEMLRALTDANVLKITPQDAVVYNNASLR